MKTAAVKQRRTAPDGRRMVNVNCPACGHRHWVADTADPVRCPLRLGKFFVIAAGGR
jgi:hypothetical protein